MWGDDEKSEFEGSEERILEWEVGLPSADDLTPLSQSLIPRELASAFSISPEPYGSMLDVNRASQNTISNLRRQSGTFSNNLTALPSFSLHGDRRNPFALEGEETCNGAEPCSGRDGSESRKGRRLSERDTEEADSALLPENLNDDQAARALKRPRLVWTPQLHKRFVDVVAHLGIKNAVPKTIMQLMNVEGLTRENVASHLQKYRLYLKRMQGLSNEGPSSSDHLFASTPVPQSLAASSFVPGHREESGHIPLPIPYAAPLLPVPVLGVAHGHGHMAMPVSHPGAYPGFESHPYNAFGQFVPHRLSSGEQQRDWSGNKFNSIMSYPHLTPNDK